MNKNLNATMLTRDDLANIALDNELITPDKLESMVATFHNEALLTSALSSMTAKTRFSMFMKGELEMGYEPFVAKRKKMDVDPDIVAYITRKV